MEVLRLAVRYLHLLGFAVLFGGVVANYLATPRALSQVTRAGLGIMIVSGLVLAIPFGLKDGVELDYAKLGTKFVLAFIIGALFGVHDARKKAGKPITDQYFWLLGGLVLLTAAVGVFWR